MERPRMRDHGGDGEGTRAHTGHGSTRLYTVITQEGENGEVG